MHFSCSAFSVCTFLGTTCRVLPVASAELSAQSLLPSDILAHFSGTIGVTGTNLVSAALQCVLGSTSVGVTFVSATRVNCAAPALSPGNYSVTLSNGINGFAFVAAQQLTVIGTTFAHGAQFFDGC